MDEKQISQHALSVLAAKTYRGVGRSWLVNNLSHRPQIDEIVERLERDRRVDTPVKGTELEEQFARRRAELGDRLGRLIGDCDRVIAVGEPEFPFCRGRIKPGEYPVVLFCRGDLGLLAKGRSNAAVIGFLDPDQQIESRERQLVAELVRGGMAIVSGLARGCDAIAHRQTLESGGKTIAVLPSPLTNVLPAVHRELADAIVSSGGLLVTEYAEEAGSGQELRGRYAERDRLQAMFSDCIVLAASYAKNDQGLDSGSRLAMEFARQYGLPRLVMYDSELDADDPRFDLNRQLMEADSSVHAVTASTVRQIVEKVLGDRSANSRREVQPTLFS
ncbi:MAG: hypothetical protein KatS3mg111_1719 [Pirellulaceae bacterium]|nr:MAG: hypothetical protein KatS3mg111_1719 [Pirellulaceae bacterium]